MIFSIEASFTKLLASAYSVTPGERFPFRDLGEITSGDPSNLDLKSLIPSSYCMSKAATNQLQTTPSRVSCLDFDSTKSLHQVPSQNNVPTHLAFILLFLFLGLVSFSVPAAFSFLPMPAICPFVLQSVLSEFLA